MAKPEARAWSYARLSDYRACPKKYEYKVLYKLKEPPNQAMARGLLAHKVLEDFVRGHKKILPPDLKKMRPQLQAFMDRGAEPELELAFDQDWQHQDWYGPKVWLRVKLDLAVPFGKHRLDVVDYKTGRVKPEEHQEPLELYALAAFLKLGNAKVHDVRTFAWYVDHEEKPRQLGDYVRSDVTTLQRKWAKEGKACSTATRFAATPSRDACKWCAFSKYRHPAGPCQEALA